MPADLPTPRARASSASTTSVISSSQPRLKRVRADVDPIVKSGPIEEMASAYLGDRDRRTALASPLFADLRGLPPLLVHVGSDEVLLDDAVQLAERAREAGVTATLEVWDRMIHVWHWFLPMLEEAESAVGGIGRFIRSRM